MATARELTSAEIARYRATARRRHHAEQAALALREQRAWDLARRASTLLRDQFHVDLVVVFGSLVHPGCFTAWSDVDLAARGIDPSELLRAMERVRDLSDEIPVNLVDLTTCSPSLRSVVERDGRPV